MNSAGKTFLAALTLSGLLGVGWWVIERPQSEIDPFTSTPQPAQPGVAPNTAIEVAAKETSDPGLPKPDAALLAQIEAASLKLDGIILSVDQMRLVSAPQPLTAQQSITKSSTAQSSAAHASSPQASESLWSDIVRAIKAQLVEVVQIRRVENPDALFLTPEQGALVVERLRLRLLSARIALSLRHDKLFIQDLDQAEQLLSKAFDPEDPRVVAAKQGIGDIRVLKGRL